MGNRRAGPGQMWAPGLLLACAFGLGGAGCSSPKDPNLKPVHPVRGQVFVKDQPAAGAFVLLIPLNEASDAPDARPRGEVGEDGSFKLSTFGSEDGAPAGEYVVTIRWPGKVLPDGREEPEDKLFGRYADRSKSNLRATVKEGPNELAPYKLK